MLTKNDFLIVVATAACCGCSSAATVGTTQPPDVVSAVQGVTRGAPGYSVTFRLTDVGTGDAVISTCLNIVQRRTSQGWISADNVTHDAQCADQYQTLLAGASAQLSFSMLDLLPGDSVRILPEYGGIPGAYPTDYKVGKPSPAVVVR
jgi:hypothetical protein